MANSAGIAEAGLLAEDQCGLCLTKVSDLNNKAAISPCQAGYQHACVTRSLSYI